MGGFGAPDRGGSREGKKSLRGNKQALQKLIKDEQKGHVRTGPRPTISEQPPPALPPNADGPALVDTAAQLGSRQFDRDQFKVLQRAASSGVGPIVTYTTDDSKLDGLVRAAKENAGQLYCMVGVHSDNIKRANDRLSPARLEQLKDLALEAGCVAVLAGLAFRDVGIRYAQERALSEQMELAASVGLPLVLYEVRAAEALVERITEFRSGGAGEGRAATTPIAIFNFAGTPEELAGYLELGCYIVLTGRVCDSTERAEALRTMVASIPRDRLMLASDSPFTTPQNIPDVFMREGRNEPSNLPYVVQALAPALGMSVEELAAATRRNALTFFGIREAAEAAAEVAAAAAAAAVAGAGTTTAAGTSAVVAPAEAPDTEGKNGKAGKEAPGAGGAESRGRKGQVQGEGSQGRREEEEEGAEEEEEEGSGDDALEQGSKKGGSERAGRAANLFALMKLQEEEEEGAEAEEEDEEREQDRARAARSAGASTSGAAAAPAPAGAHSGEDGDGTLGPEAATAAGSRKGGARGGTGGSVSKPAPRNFVAEYAAAAAAKGPVSGPRVSYSCRGCRSVLFTEADTEPHEDEERVLFGATKPRKKGKGKAGRDSEGGLCSMYFLRKPLAWMETCLQSEGPRLGEGKLVCPSCAAKLGKWAAGPGAGGVQCSCGVVVPAPAYSVLKARLDILDAQLDIASAVQSTLKAYEEEEAADSGASSSGDEGAAGSRKKRQKQKRNKTANFSSFRNKNFGFSLKQQRHLAETVTATASGGGGGGAGGLGAVSEESD